MALTTTAIKNLNIHLWEIKHNIDESVSFRKENISKLSSDANYQKFVEGTEYGSSLNERLLKIADLLNSLHENELSNIVIMLQEFSDRQATLNK